MFTKFTLPRVAREVITFSFSEIWEFAEAPNLHRTRSRHKGTPAKAQGASNASDFVCQEKWQMPGVFGCDVCVCVWIMCDVCCWCVSWSCYGEFCGYLLVMCVECLVMFVPTSAVLHFVWIVGEIFVVYTSITKVRIGRVFWLKGGSEWHSGSARFCANTSRCRKNETGQRPMYTWHRSQRKFWNGNGSWLQKAFCGVHWVWKSKSSVESVQMVHTNLMPPHSIIPVSAGSWRTPKVFHVQLLSFTIIAPLGTLYLSLYTIHILSYILPFIFTHICYLCSI